MTKRPFIFLLLLVTAASAQHVFGQTASRAGDNAAVAESIRSIGSTNEKVRDAAASKLRRIVAKYKSGTANILEKDGGKARWQKRVDRIVPGMAEAEVSKILPPFADGPERTGIGSGDSHITSYRLDNVWLVVIHFRNPDKVIRTPELVKSHRYVYVEPPEDFTGTWTCFHVNGQTAFEIQYVGGKINGTFSRFYDNGRRTYEQHYVDEVVDGADTGWYSDGKLMYSGQYRRGKQDGQWVHFYPDGSKRSESNFDNGVRHGRLAQWYENGQMSFEQNYRNGIQHGTDAAWNEKGILQYKHEYRNGVIIP